MAPESGPNLRAGRTLGHYRLLERVGSGGMGQVWRARDERLERDVALKVLLPGTIADESARRRFHREALALSKLNHPHIATVFDFDSEAGLDFLVMEYVGGASLGAHRGEGALPEAEVVRLGVQLAEGLAAAHGAGVVHRDLKPANVRMTADGRLKILDFGLAHLTRTTGDNTGSAAATQSVPMTESGALVGTLAYMAPEQVRGERVDARTDLWAVGLVLYELATGRLAYEERDTAPLLHAILNQPVPPPRQVYPSLSLQLEAIVLKCLEKEPAKRYGSAGELTTDLLRLERGESVHAERSRERSRRMRALAVLGPTVVVATVVMLLALDVGGLRGRLFAPAPIRSIAVLPLVNLSGDPEQEYFADGMTEELINRLAAVSALRVTSRSSAMQFKSSRTPISEIARRLKVEGIIEGSVRRTENRVRVTVQLVQASADRSLWGSAYERTVSDIFALQSDVAQAIASQIRIALTPGERTRLAERRQVNPAAHEEYLKARFQLNRFNEAGSRGALEGFKRALEIDPGFAPAHVGVAEAYNMLSTLYMPATDAMPKARAAGALALELDPNLAGAHAVRGYVSAFHDWRWREAEADFRRALELTPGDATTHVYLGYMLVCLGRFEEASQVYAKAQQLDPLSNIVASMRLWPLYEGRRYEEAIQAANALIAQDSTSWNAYQVKAQSLTQLGRLDEAEGMIRATERRQATRMLTGHAVLAAYRGRRAEALELLKPALRSGSDPYTTALAYGILGEHDLAFTWLERAMREHNENLAFLKVDPVADSLRSDPRFADVLRRLGFEH